MGIRCTQVIGLNERALALIEPSRRDFVAKGERVYDDGSVDKFEDAGSELECEETGAFSGMFDEPYSLHTYNVNGSAYSEYVQAEPWSSGPCFFLALRDTNGNVVVESLWTDEEIRREL